MLHLRRVAQKVCCKQSLGQNRADLLLCVDRTLFPALDVQRQAVVEVVAVNDYRDFQEGEEDSQLLPSLMMSLSLVEARFSTHRFIKAMMTNGVFLGPGGYVAAIKAAQLGLRVKRKQSQDCSFQTLTYL